MEELFVLGLAFDVRLVEIKEETLPMEYTTVQNTMAQEYTISLSDGSTNDDSYYFTLGNYCDFLSMATNVNLH